MNARNWQPLAHASLTLVSLVIVVGGSACDSGYKQIGGLDDGATTTTYGGPDDDDGGDGDAFECIEQDVDVEVGPLLPIDPNGDHDLLFRCAANVEPSADGWLVTFTFCSDEEGKPQADREIVLSGAHWPEPELADGDQPLHEVRYSWDNSGNGHGTRELIVRTLDHQRVSLYTYEGSEFLFEPGALSPLWLSLDEAACTAGPLPCSPETMYQEFPVGFAIGYGDTFGNVAHDMMLTDFGVEEGTDTVHDVLVGFAVTHECYDDGDFRELQLGIVARTVDAP